MPIALKIRTQRLALARMYIDLTLAFHATTLPPEQPDGGEPDGNLTLVAVAVMAGHAEGRPKNASQIAADLHMPRTSVLRRLETLIAHGLVQRLDGKYYLEPSHAANVPHRDNFELILSRAFAVLGPHLSKLDT